MSTYPGIQDVPSDDVSAARDAEGVEARIAAADSGAEAEAEADRRALLDSTGIDPNHTAEKIEIIRRHNEGDATG